MKSAPRQARSRKKSNNLSNTNLNIIQNTMNIPGLYYIDNFLSKDEHDNLMSILYTKQNHLWIYEELSSGDTLSRRNQQFGWKYNYATQDIEKVENDVPDWINPYIKRLQDLKILNETPEQMIVSEYTPGQGITPHIDKVHCFGDVIIGISLGSSTVLNFSPLSNRNQIIEVFIKPRSCYLMTGPARYEYLHSIKTQMYDTINNRKITRGKRVSLTLRRVKDKYKDK